MIKAENLTKVFRTEEIETTALNGVSFEINDGELGLLDVVLGQSVATGSKIG